MIFFCLTHCHLAAKFGTVLYCIGSYSDTDTILIQGLDPSQFEKDVVTYAAHVLLIHITLKGTVCRI